MRKSGSLTFWMILLGAFAAWMSTEEILRNWDRLVTGARVCDVIFLACGILLLIAGGWRGLSRSAPRAASWLGSISAAAFALTLLAGVLSGAIPCSSAG